MRAVDGDASLSESHERGLLRITESDGFHTGEDEGMVRDDDVDFLAKGFGNDGRSEIDGQEDFASFGAFELRKSRAFDEDTDVVPTAVSELEWSDFLHRGNNFGEKWMRTEEHCVCVCKVCVFIYTNHVKYFLCFPTY